MKGIKAKLLIKALEHLADAYDLLEQVNADAEDYQSERSEKWAESEAGEAFEEIKCRIEDIYSNVESSKDDLYDLLDELNVDLVY